MTFGKSGCVVVLGAAMAIAAPAMAGQEVRQQPSGKSRSDAEKVLRDSDGEADSRSVAVRDKTSRPSTATDANFDAGMAAIRAKEPGKAVELMRPVLANFEKQYAGEEREIYCAVTPEQSSRY